MTDDFYVGYDTVVPPRSRRLVRGGIALVFGASLSIVAVVLVAERPFANSHFAFGESRPVSGHLVSRPYPTLVVEHSGAAEPSRILLVAPGKHGAAALTAPFEGRDVRLMGSLIDREGREAIEIEPGTITATVGTAAPVTEASEMDLGIVTLRGEIVDGKCYLGVMNPGEGATHRDCAVQCIRGGLPPLFAARDDAGRTQVFTLASADRAPVNGKAADLVGRPLEITGHAFRTGNELLLLADPRDYRLLR